jgi:hypothetical protein
MRRWPWPHRIRTSRSTPSGSTHERENRRARRGPRGPRSLRHYLMILEVVLQRASAGLAHYVHLILWPRHGGCPGWAAQFGMLLKLGLPKLSARGKVIQIVLCPWGRWRLCMGPWNCDPINDVAAVGLGRRDDPPSLLTNCACPILIDFPLPYPLLRRQCGRRHVPDGRLRKRGGLAIAVSSCFSPTRLRRFEWNVGLRSPRQIDNGGRARSDTRPRCLLGR